MELSLPVDECLRRIAERDADIRAWVEVGPQAPTGSGSLDGISFGVKDIFDTAALGTEYGSHLYRGRKATRDADLVAQLRANGALLIGKTHTTAFASFDPAPTRNPRAPGRTPGGSSAGSAAAVAAGMVPVALGTQTLGSILRPASYCGVCGFKPTYGVLPLAGALAFAPSLDTAGFFTQTADAMAKFWELLRGTREGEPGPREAQAARFVAPAGWCELIAAAYTVNRYEGSRSHAARYEEFGERIGVRLAALIREGLATPEAEYDAALEHIRHMRGVMAEQFAQTPFLLSPAATGFAPLGYESTGDPAANAPWTALGIPAIAIPLPGATPPIGLQITAAWGNDDALVAFARRLERILSGATM